MRKQNKIIGLMLAILTCFSMASCRSNEGESSSSSQVDDSTSNRVEAVITDSVISAKTRNVKVSLDASMNESSDSVVDLLYFFDKAMNFRPEIVADTATIDDDYLYIAIGPKNKMLLDNAARTGYELLTTEELGYSGIALQTFDNVTCMYGMTEAANCNAVYEFLKYTFNYEYFAKESYNIDQCINAVWKDFDVQYKPLIDMPCLMYGSLQNDVEWMRRARAKNYFQTFIYGYAHSHFQLMPKETYQAAHPEWYSPTGVHLCMTGGGISQEELINTMAKNICDIIAADKSGKSYFPIGGEDSFTICSCESCREYVSQYETSTLGASVLNIEFSNKVVEKVNAWMAENCPERDVTFVAFAYNATKEPPVRFDEETGAYIPIIKTVENLNVQFVINFVDYAKPYTDHENYVAMMEGWRAVSEDLSVWQYSTNFMYFTEPFENWGSMAANYKWLAQNGVTYIAEQASYSSSMSNFEEMRIYVMSNLCWGETDDTEYLVNKFLKGYFGEAAENMRTVYDLTRSNLAVILSNGVIVSSGDIQIMQQKNWSYAFLNRLDKEIDKAIEKIAVYKRIRPIFLLHYLYIATTNNNTI